MERYKEDLLRGQFGLMNKLRPLGYRIEKVLGKGGFGLACLCTMRDVDGKTHRIVVKASTRLDRLDTMGLDEERKNCEYERSPAFSCFVSQ